MNNTKAEQLARTLRDAREASGLSVRQLSAQSGVAKSVISHFEREGTGTAHNLLSLARALELRESDLFSRAGRPMPRLTATLPAMLRAEYDLPPEAIKEVQQSIEAIARRYQRDGFD
jgi:transcriptional regulator with XRE-family HTH domain